MNVSCDDRLLVRLTSAALLPIHKLLTWIELRRLRWSLLVVAVVVGGVRHLGGDINVLAHTKHN